MATAVDALAAAIAAWIERAARTEAQRTSFAFREGGAEVELPPVTSLDAFVSRTLASAGDPATVRLLAATRDGVALADLLARDDLGVTRGDRVALAERVGMAAGVGLVGRELEGDRVACTPLGTALLDLVQALEAGVRERTTTSAGVVGR